MDFSHSYLERKALLRTLWGWQLDTRIRAERLASPMWAEQLHHIMWAKPLAPELPPLCNMLRAGLLCTRLRAALLHTRLRAEQLWHMAHLAVRSQVCASRPPHMLIQTNQQGLWPSLTFVPHPPNPPPWKGPLGFGM